jgi:hypothetical protein
VAPGIGPNPSDGIATPASDTPKTAFQWRFPAPLPAGEGAPETLLPAIRVAERCDNRSVEGLVLGVILTLTSFGLATLTLVGLLIAVTLLHRAPTRPCHRCGRRVKLEHRTCRHCGYEFEPVRFGR